jgi:hypothetical protein
LMEGCGLVVIWHVCLFVPKRNPAFSSGKARSRWAWSFASGPDAMIILNVTAKRFCGFPFQFKAAFWF